MWKTPGGKETSNPKKNKKNNSQQEEIHFESAIAFHLSTNKQ
jgi:hypothetical protein